MIYSKIFSKYIHMYHSCSIGLPSDNVLTQLLIGPNLMIFQDNLKIKTNLIIFKIILRASWCLLSISILDLIVFTSCKVSLIACASPSKSDL